VQAINYPTVARGEERLRITVTPRHSMEQMQGLVRAVDQVFTELNINRLSNWKLVGGRAGVGVPGASDTVDPIWTDKQVGICNGTVPRSLRDGEKAIVDAKAVNIARSRFDLLLGPMYGKLQPTRDFGYATATDTVLKTPLGSRDILLAPVVSVSA